MVKIIQLYEMITGEAFRVPDPAEDVDEAEDVGRAKDTRKISPPYIFIIYIPCCGAIPHGEVAERPGHPPGEERVDHARGQPAKTVEQEPLMKNVPALTVLAQALREGLSKEGTARSLPRLSQGGEWVIEAPGAIAAVDGKTLTFLSRQDDDDEGTRDGLVRLSVPLAAGRYEVRFKLLEDEVHGDDASAGFGLIKEGATEAFELQAWSDDFGVQNLWWLRRFERTVYSERETSGNFDDEADDQPYQQFPIPSDVRIVVDMDAGEATFYVDEVEIPHKATGITGPVFPCAWAYSREEEGTTNVVVSFAGVRRL